MKEQVHRYTDDREEHREFYKTSTSESSSCGGGRGKKTATKKVGKL